MFLLIPEEFLPLMLLIYTIEFALIITASVFLIDHLIMKYKKGFISVFMGTLAIHFISLGISTLSAFLINISEENNFSDNILFLIWLLLILSNIVMSITFLIMIFFFITKRFDIYITKLRNVNTLKEDEKDVDK